MAEIGNTSVFSQTDGSNNTGTVPTWAEGQAPSQVNDSARALQGAVTREWNWRNPTLTTTGSANAYVLTYSVAPAALYNGQTFAFYTNFANTGSATLNINTIGAKTIKKMVAGIKTALASGDVASGALIKVAYNLSDDSFIVLVGVGASLSLASTTDILTGTDTAKATTADSIAALWEQGADVASAGTTSLGEGGYFNITGTTTITDIDFATDKAGRFAWVKFAGILTLTHNSSTLILPTGANITTAAGDCAHFVSEGTDVVRCTSYMRADGTALTSSGGLSAASQAQMEAASVNTVASTPGVQHFHPGHPKVWMRAAGAGTLTESYNMTSVTDTGTGQLGGTIATDFNTATWCLIASILGAVDVSQDYNNDVIAIAAQAAGTFSVDNIGWAIDDDTISQQALAFNDPTSYSLVGLGDFA